MPCPDEWNLPPERARALQRDLASEVRLQPLPEEFQVLGSSDIGYVKATDQLVAVVLTFRWPGLEPLETAQFVSRAGFPYIPGLLSFREVPPLMEACCRLERLPDVLLCDGQGIAHPRRLGLASHLGLCLDIPTIGCAKERLWGRYEPFELRRGSAVPLRDKDETIGYVLCSRDGVKPLFISPGHLADLPSSLHVIQKTLGRFRLPEPLRQAHNTATALRRGLQAALIQS